MSATKVLFAGWLPDDRSETSLVLTIATPRQMDLPRELLPFGLAAIVAVRVRCGQATRPMTVG